VKFYDCVDLMFSASDIEEGENTSDFDADVQKRLEQCKMDVFKAAD
jgi:hypothetical protein